jgi:hypothetical protein
LLSCNFIKDYLKVEANKRRVDSSLAEVGVVGEREAGKVLVKVYMIKVRWEK